MKELKSQYKRYMIRPILYKIMSRAAFAAVPCLLWQRFISDGRFSIWAGPGLLAGVVFLFWAWICYLDLDGFQVHHILEKSREQRELERKSKKRHTTRSMVDFADEKIISFDELEADERSLCSMTANLFLGGVLVVVGGIAGLM